MEMNLAGRNTVWGIRDRTIKNLEFLNSARVMGADVHVVTALISSLMGLIVFPYQQIRESKYADFKKYSLKELSEYGWPEWELGGSVPCDNLHDLVYHLRNAISHHRVIFGSDARELAHVNILFFDRKNPQGPDDWDGTINAAKLLDFVLLFAKFLKEWEHDYS